jgi:hemolysin D
MAVVPAESPLEIEATVSNQDIGFVHAGQKAAIKIDTFSFTRYGLLHGEILSVSLDAVSRTPEMGTGRGVGAAAVQPQSTGGGLAYTARISLDRTTMQTENGLIDARPGMAVTVEIDTGTRQVIDYLLTPLLRYTQESLRER